MKTPTLSTLLVAIQLVPGILFAQDKNSQSGADLFRQNCGACHTVGKGKLVGPDLQGVENRHPETWLHKWIHSSQGLINSGDEAAKKLFADNAQVPMPDQALTDDQIDVILGYIKGETGEMIAVDPKDSAVSVSTSVVSAVPVPPNNGFEPLMSGGSPAQFKNAPDEKANDTSNWGGNKWLVMLVIACVVGSISTTVVFLNADLREEHQTKKS